MAASRKTLTFVFVIVVVRLLVQVDSATISRQDEVPPPPVASQQQRRSLEEKCPAGYHRSEPTGACNACTEGVDYTSASNNEPFCLPCAVCKSDEEEMSPCTTTSNRVCQCKPGSFWNGNSTEMCRKCSTGCPRGMVKVKDCTPWSDIECVHKESGIIIGVIVLVVIVVVAVIVWKTSLWKKVLPYLKGVCSGGGGDPERVDSSSHSPQRPGAEDNALNEIVSIVQPSQVPEQEMEVQEPAEQTDVNTLSPGESEHLLEPAKAEGPQRRGQLVPVNENDPTETLRQCFDDFAAIVPFDAWEPLVRQLGLTNNEIKVAKAEAASSRDTLYVMLIKWVNKTGRAASVNTLLDALETLEERLAKQKIQDRLLSSGKFMYLEDNADSATS
uniref:TNF receptor superfamily member 10b n=1 Tax=Macaca mulatta TaxID=9544 RepID=A0A1D5QP14_MACMU